MRLTRGTIYLAETSTRHPKARTYGQGWLSHLHMHCREGKLQSMPLSAWSRLVKLWPTAVCRMKNANEQKKEAHAVASLREFPPFHGEEGDDE